MIFPTHQEFARWIARQIAIEWLQLRRQLARLRTALAQLEGGRDRAEPMLDALRREIGWHQDYLDGVLADWAGWMVESRGERAR